MPKNYVLFNFTDYKGSDEDQSIRTTPINSLLGSFERRIERKGGSFAMYNMADFFAELRTSRHGAQRYHAVEGVLDRSWVYSLVTSAAVYRSRAWTEITTAAREADKIILAAHGNKDDTDNVYCDHNMNIVRVGNSDGIVEFLNTMLNGMERDDPTITLVICYAARSERHDVHHVNTVLTADDLRSSLAFKVFTGVSTFRPRVRLTARTGAMSGSDVGSSLLSETEEAIIASETIRTQFGDAEDLVASTMQAYNAFDLTLDQSNLTATERTQARNALYQWFTGGFDPNEFDQIVNAIDRLDGQHKARGYKFLEALCCCGCVSFAWYDNYRNQRETLENLIPRRHRLQTLHATSQISQPKYGKFIYQIDNGATLVSRWLGDQIVQLMRL